MNHWKRKSPTKKSTFSAGGQNRPRAPVGLFLKKFVSPQPPWPLGPHRMSKADRLIFVLEALQSNGYVSVENTGVDHDDDEKFIGSPSSRESGKKSHE